MKIKRHRMWRSILSKGVVLSIFKWEKIPILHNACSAEYRLEKLKNTNSD